MRVKKALPLLIFTLAVGIVLMLASSVMKQNEGLENRARNSCETISDNEAQSVRSLGLIVRGRALLAVLLEGERNYSPPGGHFDLAKNDVSTEDTVIRELKEELGIAVKNSDLNKYGVFCEVLQKSAIQKTHLYFIEDWQGNLQPTYKTSIKWVASDFVLDNKADDELKTVLNMLKSDNLID